MKDETGPRSYLWAFPWKHACLPFHTDLRHCCDGEAFSSPPLPLPVCLKLFTRTAICFSFLIFLDPRCSHSLWFYFFSPYGELWEDNILSDHSQLETISQYLALLLFLQSLILVAALLFPFVSLRVFGLTLCIQPRDHRADSLNSPTLVTSCTWWDPNANCAADCPTFHGVCIWFPTINGVWSVFLFHLYYSPAYLPEIIWAAELSDSFDQN